MSLGKGAGRGTFIHLQILMRWQVFDEPANSYRVRLRTHIHTYMHIVWYGSNRATLFAGSSDSSSGTTVAGDGGVRALHVLARAHGGVNCGTFDRGLAALCARRGKTWYDARALEREEETTNGGASQTKRERGRLLLGRHPCLPFKSSSMGQVRSPVASQEGIEMDKKSLNSDIPIARSGAPEPLVGQ